MKNLPSKEDLRELLDYDPETGLLTWKSRDLRWFEASATRTAAHVGNQWNSRYAGTGAFTAIDHYGYCQGALFNRSCKAHRIIWKLVHGTEPIEVDHIDGDRSNNRISNLRSVTAAENRRNQRIPRASVTGILGVTPVKKNGRFYAHIKVDGKAINLGVFDTINEAAAARLAASIKFGFHPNHGDRLAQ